MNNKLYKETIDNTIELLTCDYTKQSSKWIFVLERLGSKINRTPEQGLLHIETHHDGSKSYYHMDKHTELSADGVENYLSRKNAYIHSRHIQNIMQFGRRIIVPVGNSDIFTYDMYLNNGKILCKLATNFYIDDNLLVCTNSAGQPNVKIYDSAFNLYRTIECNGVCYGYVVSCHNYNYYAYSLHRECIDIINMDGASTYHDPITFLTCGNERITFRNVCAFLRLKISNYLLMINNNDQLLVIDPIDFHVVLDHKLKHAVRTVRNLGNDCFDIHYCDINYLKIERFRFSMKKITEIVDVHVSDCTEENTRVEGNI